VKSVPVTATNFHGGLTSSGHLPAGGPLARAPLWHEDEANLRTGKKYFHLSSQIV